ncbi:glycoside hydrolase family 26 protein [Streptomyces roseirectus]|uniref:glycoside hydrolase family 26 protein n=1 Tax=Streptomyces roseirectus TaxID=2768066 RepID=UPI001FE51156|nr:glycosyl hydrolase [Streptomyces roseirectus]
MSSRVRALFLPLLTLLLLAAQSCVPSPHGTDARPAQAGPPSPRSVKFGAYVGYGTDGIARISGLDAWLGRSTPTVGHAYLPGDRWSNIEGAPGYLAHWAAWRKARKDRLFVLNVPLLERNEAHLPDATVRAELRKAARGTYDRHFRALAQRLVRLGLRDTVLVLGWEMNGITYTHRCGPDPAAWKRYWVRIVTAMRKVPGQRFRFEFTPNRGRDAIPWPRCYPGDRHVDVIGMDAYDSPRGMSFTAQLNEPYGLRAHVRFARAHRKPIAFPEWGLYENGDNPAYMRGMLSWMARQKPLYQTISDYCPHGVWRCRKNPRASAVYKSLMGRKR